MKSRKIPFICLSSFPTFPKSRQQLPCPLLPYGSTGKEVHVVGIPIPKCPSMLPLPEILEDELLRKYFTWP